MFLETSRSQHWIWAKHTSSDQRISLHFKEMMGKEIETSLTDRQDRSSSIAEHADSTGENLSPIVLFLNDYKMVHRH